MLSIQLITQERILRTAHAGEVLLPTTLGQLGVLPGHQTLVAELVPGEVELKSGLGGKILETFAVTGGVVEIKNGNAVLILAHAAEPAEEIHETRAREALKRAQRMMQEEGYKDDTKYADAAAALERSIARLKVVRKHRTHRSPEIES